MTRVDFYILPEKELSALQTFACKLIQKTSRLGHKIYVHCPNEQSCQQLDKLLWSFQAHSFIPHKIFGQSGAECNIEIGFGDGSGTSNEPGNHHDLLINLSASIPVFFSRFERVAEIVIQEPAILDASRNNYRFYANKNYPLHRHDLR